MKTTLMMDYKSIISHGDNQNEVTTYHGLCDYETSLFETSYSFTHPDYGKMAIYLKGNQASLFNGHREIPLELERYIPFDYHSDYGVIQLRSFLKKIEKDSKNLNLVYYLDDGVATISKCYITIRIKNEIIS